MENVNIKAARLKKILTLFHEMVSITEIELATTYKYLFDNELLLPFFKDSELFETIIYLKDVIEANELFDISKLEMHFNNKEKELTEFIENTIAQIDNEAVDSENLIFQISGNLYSIRELATQHEGAYKYFCFAYDNWDNDLNYLQEWERTYDQSLIYQNLWNNFSSFKNDMEIYIFHCSNFHSIKVKISNCTIDLMLLGNGNDNTNLYTTILHKALGLNKDPYEAMLSICPLYYGIFYEQEMMKTAVAKNSSKQIFIESAPDYGLRQFIANWLIDKTTRYETLYNGHMIHSNFSPVSEYLTGLVENNSLLLFSSWHSNLLYPGYGSLIPEIVISNNQKRKVRGKYIEVVHFAATNELLENNVSDISELLSSMQYSEEPDPQDNNKNPSRVVPNFNNKEQNQLATQCI